MAQEPPPHLWRFQGFRPCLTTRTEGRKALLKTLRRQRSAPLARLPGFRKLPLHRSSTAPCVAGRSGKLATGGCIPVFGNCSASKPPHNTSVEPTSRDNAALVGSLFALYGTVFSFAAPVQFGVNLLVVELNAVEFFLVAVGPQIPFVFQLLRAGVLHVALR